MIETPEQQPEKPESRDAQQHPAFAPPFRETGIVAAAPDDWGRAEMEPVIPPSPAVPRDRILSPKVLIAWAALTLFAYFGIRVVGTAIRDSVKQAIVSSARAAKNSSGPDIVILLPNGKKITIHRDNPTPRPGAIPPGAAVGADPDPDVDVDIQGATVPKPATPTSPKAAPAAKAPPPADAKASATRR